MKIEITKNKLLAIFIPMVFIGYTGGASHAINRNSPLEFLGWMCYIIVCAYSYSYLLTKYCKSTINYIGNEQILNVISIHLSEKIINEITLRKIFDEPEYTHRELFDTIKEELTNLNIYGFGHD